MTDLRTQVESQTPLARPSYRADIQGLRAVAVILVVLWHAGVTQARGGFIGVDVFFVISGYVITSLLRRQPRQSIWLNLRGFYARRIRRIVPAATVVLIATTIVAYFIVGANFDPTLIGDVRWASFFLANARFIATATPYPIAGVPASLVTHFWSLAVEEQFYLVWPLIVFSILWFAPARRRTAALASGLVLIIVASALWSAHVSNIPPLTTAFYSPFTRGWELALGALVSLIPSTWAQRFPEWSAMLGWTAMLAIIAAATTITYGGPWPGTLAWWPCGATAVVLVTGACESPLGPLKLLGTRGAQWVGDRSYSLYLWHYLWLMTLIDQHNAFQTTYSSALARMIENSYSSWWIRVIEIAGAVACAALSYRYLENPIRHSKLLDRDPTAVFIMLAVCLAATFATTYVIAHLANLT